MEAYFYKYDMAALLEYLDLGILKIFGGRSIAPPETSILKIVNLKYILVYN